MGWSGGSSLLSEVWDAVRLYIPEDKRELEFARLANFFEDRDCDTVHECCCDKWPETEAWYTERMCAKYDDRE